MDLAAVARAIVDANKYMVIGTADETGRPWVSPVYYAPEAYGELFWVSSPEARHSRNVAARPEVGIARQLEDVREQQRAISGVLRAVARSAGIQPVLDEVVEACKRLCRADYGALYLLEQERLHVVAQNTDAEGAEYDRPLPASSI